jgi:hypothetical protein
MTGFLPLTFPRMALGPILQPFVDERDVLGPTFGRFFQGGRKNLGCKTAEGP